MLESTLNLKNRITIDERSEEIVIRFFEFKVDSNIGWRTVFYTLLQLALTSWKTRKIANCAMKMWTRLHCVYRKLSRYAIVNITLKLGLFILLLL